MKDIFNALLIEGGTFVDERGRLDFVNEFDMSRIKRFYITANINTNLIRAWQGHKIESRWFYCIQGRFDVKIVKIDNWENPSRKLNVNEYILSSETPQVLFVPNGYVNGFRALEEDSKLMIFSDHKSNELNNDNFRFDKKLWFDWNNV